jgi:hypothetical protein
MASNEIVDDDGTVVGDEDVTTEEQVAESADDVEAVKDAETTETDAEAASQAEGEADAEADGPQSEAEIDAELERLRKESATTSTSQTPAPAPQRAEPTPQRETQPAERESEDDDEPMTRAEFKAYQRAQAAREAAARDLQQARAREDARQAMVKACQAKMNAELDRFTITAKKGSTLRSGVFTQVWEELAKFKDGFGDDTIEKVVRLKVRALVLETGKTTKVAARSKSASTTVAPSAGPARGRETSASTNGGRPRGKADLNIFDPKAVEDEIEKACGRL